MKALHEEDLNKVNGGAGQNVTAGTWMTVGGLQSSQLSMRTQPAFDYSNIIKNCGLSNGDKVQVKGEPVIGADGTRYVQVFSPATGQIGFVNMSFLQ